MYDIELDRVGRFKAREGYHVEFWVYIRKCKLTDGKRGLVFKRLTVSGDTYELGDEVYASYKTGAAYGIGNVYAVEVSNENPNRFLSPFDYAWRFPEPGIIAAWQSENRAAEITARLEREEAAGKRDNSLAEILRPLRARYMKADIVGKLALEVQVLAALRHGMDL